MGRRCFERNPNRNLARLIMETVKMTRADVEGEVTVNASDATEWEGYGFTLVVAHKSGRKPKSEPADQA